MSLLAWARIKFRSPCQLWESNIHYQYVFTLLTQTTVEHWHVHKHSNHPRQVAALAVQVVEVACPAVVTITNELADPRYPTASAKVKARRVKPTVVSPADLGLGEAELQPRVMMTRQFVPEVQGNCEFLEGEPAQVADQLIDRLKADSIL